MKILGISSYYHDSAAALIENHKIISAAQEERFTRIKHDANFPYHAIDFCLKNSKLKIDDIDYFCFYEKPFLKFERILETYLSYAPLGFKSFKIAIPIWIKEKLFQKSLLIKELKKLGATNKLKKKIIFSEHHLSHAASAFYPSPFDKAAVLTLDGVGEWATSTISIGEYCNIDIQKEIHFPHSLGLLYSAFTYYTGFNVNSGEYKLMGLAPYGTPKYANLILDNIVDVKRDGSFRLNLKYFDYCTGLKMTNSKFNELFGFSERKADQEVTRFYMDIACSIQKVLEDIVLKICRNIKKETKQKYLCMAGGVALNCVANGKIVKEGIFDDIWIQPAAGDAGGALGAALFANYKISPKKVIKNKNIDGQQGSLLGPKFSNDEILKSLKEAGAKSKKYNYEKIFELTSEAISKGKVIGWFQGRMEFGPRALGNRSILADPRSSKMQKNLNLKIKFRESFRPFAPSVLKEYLYKWFDCKNESPYMLLVYKVLHNKLKNKKTQKGNKSGLSRLYDIRSKVPAVTHVDNTARVQSVEAKTNPMYYKLLKSFYKKTSCPMLINTSFNIRSEPIVCTPKDAFKCLMGTDMDILVIGNYIVKKLDQDKKLTLDYRKEFVLD